MESHICQALRDPAASDKIKKTSKGAVSVKRFASCLLICDYDNTLTDRQGVVPAANLEALEYFTSHGGTFTVATGRSLPTARKRLKSLPINTAVIVCNGAACCTRAGDLLLCRPLPEGWEILAKKLADREPLLLPEVQSIRRHRLFFPSPMREAWLTAARAEYTYGPVDPAINLIFYIRETDPYILSPHAPEARLLSTLEQKINSIDGYEAVHSAPGMLEVQAAGVSKGTAARELARQLGKEKLICVGDAPNDLSMLQTADLACVPADCHSRLQNLGFHTLAPCGDGTVADLIGQTGPGQPVITFLPTPAYIGTETPLPRNYFGE